jgi:hypothetical protein
MMKAATFEIRRRPVVDAGKNGIVHSEEDGCGGCDVDKGDNHRE